MADTDGAITATATAKAATEGDATAPSPSGSPVAKLRSSATRRRRSSMDSVDADFAEVQEMFPMRSVSTPAGDLSFANTAPNSSSPGGSTPPPTTPSANAKDKRRGSVMQSMAGFQRSNSISENQMGSPKSKNRSRSLILSPGAINRKFSLTSPARKGSLLANMNVTPSRQSRMNSLTEVTCTRQPAATTSLTMPDAANHRLLPSLLSLRLLLPPPPLTPCYLRLLRLPRTTRSADEFCGSAAPAGERRKEEWNGELVVY